MVVSTLRQQQRWNQENNYAFIFFTWSIHLFVLNCSIMISCLCSTLRSSLERKTSYFLLTIFLDGYLPCSLSGKVREQGARRLPKWKEWFSWSKFILKIFCKIERLLRSSIFKYSEEYRNKMFKQISFQAVPL